MAVMIINLKEYEQGTGKKAVELARIAEKVSKESNQEIIVAGQALDIKELAFSVSIPVFIQHMDAVEYGAHTGSILPEAAKNAGAEGTLINHSEKRIPREDIKKIVERAKSLRMRICICAQDPDEAAELSDLKPEFVAYEPPELIGGDISVSTAKPELIKDAVAKVKSRNPEVRVLVGAGIKNTKDVKKSIELGAEGILVASGVVKAEDPEQAIWDMVSGF